MRYGIVIDADSRGARQGFQELGGAVREIGRAADALNPLKQQLGEVARLGREAAKGGVGRAIAKDIQEAGKVAAAGNVEAARAILATAEANKQGAVAAVVAARAADQATGGLERQRVAMRELAVAHAAVKAAQDAVETAGRVAARTAAIKATKDEAAALRDASEATAAFAQRQADLLSVTRASRDAARAGGAQALARDIRDAARAAAEGNVAAAQAVLASATANRDGAAAALQMARAMDAATGGAERQRDALRDLAAAHTLVKAAQDAVDTARTNAARAEAVQRTEAEARALREAADAQARYNQQLGVSPAGNDNYASRAADMAAWAQQIDNVRSKYVPFEAQLIQARQALVEVADAERLGILTANEAADAKRKLGDAIAHAEGQARKAANGGIALASHQVANLSYQVNDVFVQLAMGTNPFMIMIQQGPQVVEALGGVAGAWKVMKAAAAAAFAFLTTNPWGIALTAATALAGAAYLLTQRTKENASAFKTLDDALSATAPSIGQVNDGLDKLAERLSKVSAAGRKLMEVSLAESIKAAKAELKTQADLIKEVVEEGTSVAAVRGRGSRGEKLPASPVAEAVRDLLKDFDPAKFIAKLDQVQGAQRKVFAATVEGTGAFDGQKVGVVEVANAMDELRRKLALLEAKQRILNGNATDADYALVGQAKAADQAADAIKAYNQSLDPVAAATAQYRDQAAALRKELEAGLLSATDRANKTGQLARLEEIIAAVTAKTAGAMRDAAQAARFQAGEQAHLNQVTALEAQGTEAARLAVIDLTNARKLESLTLQQQTEERGAQAGQLDEIRQRYAALRQAVVEGAALEKAAVGRESQLAVTEALEQARQALSGFRDEMDPAAAAVEPFKAAADGLRLVLDRQTLSTNEAAAATALLADLQDAGSKAASRARTAREQALATIEDEAQAAEDRVAIMALEEEGSVAARIAIINLTSARKMDALEAARATALQGKLGAEIDRVNAAYDRMADALMDEQRLEIAAALRAQADEVRQVADDIAGDWAESVYDQMTGKGDSLLDWFKSLWRRIAIEALKNKIILPMTTSIVGSAPGLFGAGGGGGGAGGGLGGGLAGIANFVGGGGLAKAVNGINGLFQGGGAGIMDSIGGLFGGGMSAGAASLKASLFGQAGIRGTATSGLFGSGGTAFGSTMAANGIAGAFSGIGTGMMAGQIMGMLGIGKGNSTGAAIGGALGGALGSVVPVIGTMLGSIAGGAIGSLFGAKPSNKEGSAILDLGADRYSVGGFTGKKYSQENRDAAAQIADQVLSLKQVFEGFGAKITGTLAVGAGDRDGLFATGLNSSARTSFTADEAGTKQLLAFVAQQFVGAVGSQLPAEIAAALGRVDFSDLEAAAGDLDFIKGFRDSLSALRGDFGLQNEVTTQAAGAVKAQTDAIKEFRETTARLFPEAVAEADAALRSYVEGLVGIREAAEPLTETEAAMMALEARFLAYIPLLEEVGYTAEEAQAAMANGLAKAKEAIKADFVGALDREYNDLIGNGFINQLRDLLAGRAVAYRDADAAGVDRSVVDRNFGAALSNVLGADLRTDQLQEVIRLFGDIPEVVATANVALGRVAGGIADAGEAAAVSAERLAKTRDAMDGLADRMAKASGEANTLDGALASFDRAAARERSAVQARIDAGEVAAGLMAETESTLAEERLAIQRDYAARAVAQARQEAEITHSLADRVAALQFAGQPDAEIRMLERRQNAEFDAAKAAGWTADQLVVLAGVLGGEMTQAVAALAKQAADTAAQITHSLEDRVAALQFAGKPDAEIRMLERRQNAEFDAAKAAGWTIDQLRVLADVLAGEMTQAVGALAKQTADTAAQITRSLEDRVAALQFAGQPDAEIRMLERRQKAEMDAAKAAGWTADQLIVLAGVLEGEMAQAVAALAKQAADNEAQITRSLEDRVAALQFAGQDDAEIRMLERRQKAEMDAAKAAGWTADQLIVLAGVLEGEMAQAVGALAKQKQDAAVATAQATLDDARGTLVDALNREADAARNLANSWRQAGLTIRQALTADQLSGAYSSLSPAEAAQLAENEFRRLAARATDSSLSADERSAAAAGLPEARRAFLDAVRPLYEGTERWGEALAMSNDLLQTVAAVTDREADAADRQVQLAESQLTSLVAINQSVISVAQATTAYQQAVLELARVRAASPAATPAVPANSNAGGGAGGGDARVALASAVAKRSMFGDTEILSWAKPGGGMLGLTATELATRPQEYLAQIARQAGIPGFQRGGRIGNGLFNTDSVVAQYEGGGAIALAGGEWVTRATSVTPETAPILRAINDTGRAPGGIRPGNDNSGMERLLGQLIRVVGDSARRQADLDARGYDALADGIGQLVGHAGEEAQERRRTAR